MPGPNSTESGFPVRKTGSPIVTAAKKNIFLNFCPQASVQCLDTGTKIRTRNLVLFYLPGE